jgi:hypothetical protein
MHGQQNVKNTFNVYGSMHRNNILVYKSQQDAQVTEIILSDYCSTCGVRHSQHTQISSNSSTIAADNSTV